ncbi:MAG TPA: hypothetical protein VNM22_19465 [Candidatus Limnocylindrales bacterium]|nr:hypothetical protein [Candidatus Limnocylindrales bacterium]
MKKLTPFAVLFFFGLVTISTAYAYECPDIYGAAEKALPEAEFFAAKAAPGVKDRVMKELANAKDSIKKAKELHENAKGLEDHLKSIQLSYAALASIKIALYLSIHGK